MNNNEEKHTFDRFNKILKANINNLNIHKRNEFWQKHQVNLSENKCNEIYEQKNKSWRKQPVDLSKNVSTKSHQ